MCKESIELELYAPSINISKDEHYLFSKVP